MNSEERSRFETRSSTAGEHPENMDAGDVTVPIHLASTYALPSVDPDLSLEEIDPDRGGFLYGRLSNPTRHAAGHELPASKRQTTAAVFLWVRRHCNSICYRRTE